MRMQFVMGSLSVSPAGLNRLLTIWFAILLVIAVVSTVLVEIKRKQLVTLELRALPVNLPDFLCQSKITRWPVCYQPSAPMLILKGAHGYSLNLANTLTYLGAAYLAYLLTSSRIAASSERPALSCANLGVTATMQNKIASRARITPPKTVQAVNVEHE